jgi:two-component sensor histidine kinase
MDTATETYLQIIERVRLQQAALAEFGSFAFRNSDLQAVLDKAARACSECLGAEYAKILRYRREHGDLIVQAGVGWKGNIVGQALNRATIKSPIGRAFVTKEPVISIGLSDPAQIEFELPPIYPAHGIDASVNVVIAGLNEEPFGVLEIDTTEHRVFDRHDVDFLQAFANVTAEAVASVERLKAITEESARKDAALAERALLEREYQHRVRNHLQVLAAALQRHASRLEAGELKDSAHDIARRVVALGRIYDHMLVAAAAPRVSLLGYLQSFSETLKGFYAEQGNDIAFNAVGEDVVVDRERATSLGLVLNELVANSFEHAFPKGGGQVRVTFAYQSERRLVTLTVSDNGVGFVGASAGNGRSLVQRLVLHRLNGLATVSDEGGVRWEIVFPVEAPPS